MYNKDSENIDLLSSFAEKSLPLHYKKLRKHIHQFIEHL